MKPSLALPLPPPNPSAVAPQALRILTPLDRALPRIPRWPWLAIAGGGVLHVAAHLVDDAVTSGATVMSGPTAGATARQVGAGMGFSQDPMVIAVTVAAVAACAIGGCTLAAATEARLYAGTAHWPAWRRLLTWTLLPLALFLGLLISAALLETLLGATALSTLVPAGLWASGAAAGSLSILAIDLGVSAVATSFRTRVTAAVLLLLAIVSGALALLVHVAMAALDVVRAPGSNVKFDLGSGSPQADTARALAWIDAHPSLTLGALIGLGLLFGLPAVLSAATKLADAVMERIDPLSLALEGVARGERHVRLEEAGSEDFARLSQEFNAMVEALALSERMERAFGQYVSPQVLGRIRAQHGDGQLPASLRDASVLFADIRGFTAMSEGLPPDGVVRVLNLWFGRAVEVIAEHDGYLNKFMGDAFVVVWNGPVDQAEHAARASHCAVALQAAVAQLNADGAFPEIGGLQVGVGVASGPMLAGNIGSEQQMEYTVIGDTVNLAARLCGQAPAGQVWLSEATAHAAGTEVAREPLAPILVKGKAAPVQVWRATRASAV